MICSSLNRLFLIARPPWAFIPRRTHISAGPVLGEQVSALAKSRMCPFLTDPPHCEVHMAYQLVFQEPPAKGGVKGVGTVFLDDLPAEYKVYLFYYGGAMT